MSTPEEATFAGGLIQLRRALAGADPFAVQDEPAAFSEALRQVTGALAEAPAVERSRYLLRALDDAIAAVEVASRLADELQASLSASAQTDAATQSPADALRIAYTRFAEAQPHFQALYHYRNAVADALQPSPPPDA